MVKKTYKIKNYKGNIIESLKKFQKIHTTSKIVEAIEDEDSLKITTEDESSSIENTSEKNWDDVRELAFKLKDAYNVFVNFYEASEKAIKFDEEHDLNTPQDGGSATRANMEAQKEAIERIKSAFDDMMAY